MTASRTARARWWIAAAVVVAAIVDARAPVAKAAAVVPGADVLVAGAATPRLRVIDVVSAQTAPPARTQPLPAVRQDPTVQPQATAATPARAPAPPSVTEQWWFWAAVGGVVLTTVAVLLIAGHGQEAPRTDLGDMQAFQK